MLDKVVVDAMDRSMRSKEYKPAGHGWTALSALTLAAVPSINKAIRKRPILTPRNAVETAIMGGIGFALPKIFNNALEKYKKDPVAGREYLATELSEGRKAALTAPVKAHTLLNKQASLGSLMARGLKFGAGAAKDLGRGLIMPINPKGIKNKALSWTSKGLVGAGAISAGTYFGKESKKPDYVTYLRNQIVSGKITPDELSESDLESVRKRVL